MEKSISLYYKEGTSDKVYNLQLQKVEAGYSVTCEWGRRNTNLKITPKTAAPLELEKATKIFNQILKTQLGKGYKIAGGAESQQTASQVEKDHSGFIPQQLVRIDEEEVSKFINNPSFLAQEKHDDRRFSVIKKDGKLIGINKLGLQIPVPLPLADDLNKIDGDFHLDGELVGETLVCFDMLSIGVFNLKRTEYRERLASLTAFIGSDKYQFKHISVTYTAFSTKEKQALYDKLKAEGREGIVFKNIFASYTSGKPASGGDQFKFKFEETASFIVVARNDKRSIQIALLEKGGHKEAGNVTIPPNKEIPAVGAVVEVRYLYAYPKTGIVAQPVYLKERDDVEPGECLVSQLKFKSAA